MYKTYIKNMIHYTNILERIAYILTIDNVIYQLNAPVYKTLKHSKNVW
jgi:hypothetical protein